MKEYIFARICVHYIQARIISGLQQGAIDLDKDSLRDIAKKIDAKCGPQLIHWHLDQLVKLGVVDVIGGKKVFLLKR